MPAETLSHRKRPRSVDDPALLNILHSDKKVRPTIESGDSDGWARDSVLNTPTFHLHSRRQPKYDSDNDLSSIVSDPGSPDDIAMDDDDSDDDFPRSISPSIHPRSAAQRLRTTRVATPTIPSNRELRAQNHYKDAVKQHIRQRHPQENLSSDLLGPPSPIDEDEIPTPPSAAAEAAGSQLSLLSVNDVDMADDDHDVGDVGLPSISIETPELSGSHDDDAMSHPGSGPTGPMLVRKQRARSGALSCGNSPVRASSIMGDMAGKRGLSIGFKPDCEKCQMRVPGHMNHFIS